MIKDNVEAVLREIYDAQKSVGRIPGGVTLIAVSRTCTKQKILEAFEAGIKNFGENRIQEAKGKIESIDADIRWHFIGHLQSNKAKLAVQLFDVIHSVDSARLADILDKHCEARNKKGLDIFIQINIGEEKTKSGVKEEELIDVVKEVVQLNNLNLVGLMVIPPYSKDKEVTRKYYKKMRLLKDEVNSKLGRDVIKELSMGMSDDYDVAVEEGATFVRVGTAIFGERAHPMRKVQ
jgi:pyridoxal phosphate enzyme (YggS family)